MKMTVTRDGVAYLRPQQRRRTRAGAFAATALIASALFTSTAAAQSPLPESVHPVSAAPSSLAPGSVAGVRVVLTNDDGVQAGAGSQGLFELRKSLCAAGADVVVVGPWLDRSGASASITYGSSSSRFTLTAPVVESVYEDDCGGAPAGGAVFGACLTLAASPAPCDVSSTSLTPADAATLGASPAVQDLVGWSGAPAVIISGINRGGNDGLNVNVSGTVGAATIGSSLGVPSIAISASSSGNWLNNARAAAAWSTGFVGTLVTNGLLPEDYVVNVNYPRTDRSPITDAVWTTVAQLAAFSTGYTRDGLQFTSVYGACVPGPRCGPAEAGSDSAVYSNGKISIGAVSVDRTAGKSVNSAALEAVVRAGLVSPVRPVPPVPPVSEPEPVVVNPLTPARYWDTRNEPTLDTQFSSTGRVRAGATYTVKVSGRGDVPAGVKAVVANLVAIDPGVAGYATMFPCTATAPVASHLNYVAGDVLANTAIVPLSAAGELCVFTSSPADFALDIAGYVAADSPLAGIAAARYLDTRRENGSNTFDRLAEGGGRVAAGTVLQLQIGGRGDVPVGAQAVIVNITAVNPSAAGYLTVFDCGTRPLASTLNYLAGQVVPNGAVATLNAAGALCVYSLATTDLVVDVSGYVPGTAAGIETVTPARLLDTRKGEPTLDAAFAGSGRVGSGRFIEVDIAGRAGVPVDATAAIVNVTVVNPAAPGYVTLYPCGTRPLASNINYQSVGQVRAGNSITKLSATGTLCLYTLAETDLVLDVTGWIE